MYTCEALSQRFEHNIYGLFGVTKINLVVNTTKKIDKLCIMSY